MEVLRLTAKYEMFLSKLNKNAIVVQSFSGQFESIQVLLNCSLSALSMMLSIQRFPAGRLNTQDVYSSGGILMFGLGLELLLCFVSHTPRCVVTDL
jgi:hypothetical protein